MKGNKETVYKYYNEDYHSLDKEEGRWVIKKWIDPNYKPVQGELGYNGEASENWFKIKYQFIDYLDIKKDEKVLEHGAGDLKIVLPIALKYPHAEYWACDFSENAIVWAEKNKKEAMDNGVLKCDIKLAVQDITNIQFPDEMFDKMLIFGVLEHLEEDDYYQALKEAKRVLKTKGVLFVHSPWTEFEGGLQRVHMDLSHLHVPFKLI